MKPKRRGILHCCGKRLEWTTMEGTSILEVTCERCGAVYAMDPGGDDDLWLAQEDAAARTG